MSAELHEHEAVVALFFRIGLHGLFSLLLPFLLGVCIAPGTTSFNIAQAHSRVWECINKGHETLDSTIFAGPTTYTCFLSWRYRKSSFGPLTLISSRPCARITANRVDFVVFPGGIMGLLSCGYAFEQPRVSLSVLYPNPHGIRGIHCRSVKQAFCEMSQKDVRAGNGCPAHGTSEDWHLHPSQDCNRDVPMFGTSRNQ